MPEPDSRALLERFARDGSHDAFRAIVEQHVDIVYGAALRQVNGDAALAEDVTQQVFASLAAKARALPSGTVVAGWLYRHACYTGARAARTEKRRRLREQQHAIMKETHSPDDDAWSEIAPHLDDAIASLPPGDRDMVVLRFFSHQDFRTLGTAFGISDDTAQKRVSRALEKLRAFLSGRGVTGGAVAGLAVLLSTRAAPAAPVALNGSLAGNALGLAASGGVSSGVFMAAGWKWVAVTAGLAAAGVIVVQQRVIRTLQASSQSPETHIAMTAAPNAAKVAAVTPPAQTVSVEAILQRAAVLASQGGQAPPKDKAEIASLLERVPLESYSGALEFVLSLTDERARRRLAVDLLTRWAGPQPGAAWDFVRSRLTGRERAEALERILRTWAPDAPAVAARAVLKELSLMPVTVPPPPERQSLIDTLCQGMGRAEGPAAWKVLGLMEDEDDRAAALAALIPAAGFPPEGPAGLWAALSTVPLSARQSLEAEFAALCLRTDIRAAAGWASTLSDPEAKSRAVSALGIAWMRREPGPALAWALETAGPEQRTSLTADLLGAWAARDLNAAGAWLNGQPPSADTDAARARMAAVAVTHDPESAMAWARSITDSTARAAAVDQTWKTWRAFDPQAAGPPRP